MTDKQLLRALVAQLVENLPPSLKRTIISSREFQNRYNISTTAKISLGDGGITFSRTDFYNAVRRIYDNPDSPPQLTSDEGTFYSVSLQEDTGARHVTLASDQRTIKLPAFWFLSPNAADRLGGFDAEANKRHLVDPEILEWRERLAKAPLEDDDVDELHEELQLNPGEISEAISSEIAAGKSHIRILVPPKPSYYERLVGPLKDSRDLPSFVDRTAKERLRNLLDWNHSEGLKLALLMCPQSLLSASIEAEQIPESIVIETFKWLEEYGDRFSQVAGIELGLRLLPRFPEIEPILHEMVANLLEDDPNDSVGRLTLSANLAVFTDGELARLGILRNAPPYYRRLAALAQASLIERELIAVDVDKAAIGDWSRDGRGQCFFLQSLIDLRTEPRWLPDFMSSEQLRYEFLGRISAAAVANCESIRSKEFQELLNGDTPNSVKAQLVVPFAFLPGPLESGYAPKVPVPQEFDDLSNSLTAGEIDEGVLAPFVNSALIYRFEKEHAETIAASLRAAKYHVAIQADSDRIFSLLVGLATIASVTRSTELADEVRILARVMRRRPGVTLEPDSLMRIGMIAAAANADVDQWARRVGDWLTEVSVDPMDKDTALQMRSHVRRLCELEPHLWKTCAKADAAFSVLIGMAA